ncbi:MAG: regulatory protein RecX [Candidatus Omnitrophica bacterium]|nr:regulatory protein RecX [Candidatus Omnitrophota bacterium]
MPPLSYQEAFSYSLKLLSGRQYSEAALLEKLRGRGCSKAVYDEVVKKLRRHDLLNDRTFADAVVQNILRFQPSGRRRIRSKLKKRKVPGSVAEELISKIGDEEESHRARELAQRYAVRWAAVPKMRRLKRIYDLLVRRGFDFELCREVIDTLR